MEYNPIDIGNSLTLLRDTQPNEVHNLAAQSFIETSFNQPMATAQITGLVV